MARIAVTGAAGSVGRETLDALNEHEVVPITHREHDDLDSTVLEVENESALIDAFEGCDTVVHMAADPAATAPWESVLQANIDGTKNVFEAATRTGVDRVIFGSSNHVTHMYNMSDPTNPGTTRADSSVVSPADPFRPSSYYGVSKLAGEGLGSLYADRDGLEVINLRIGYLQNAETLREHQSDEPDRARQSRAMFLSPRDYRQAIQQAVDVGTNENPLTVNIVSRNDDRYHSIIKTIRALGYRPRENSAEILDQ
jgi:L-arabinose 1-dehydrogenase [NAD(P)+]